MREDLVLSWCFSRLLFFAHAQTTASLEQASKRETPGADPGFFSGGGAPLRNDVTDSELKNV